MKSENGLMDRIHHLLLIGLDKTAVPVVTLFLVFLGVLFQDSLLLVLRQVFWGCVQFNSIFFLGFVSKAKASIVSASAYFVSPPDFHYSLEGDVNECLQSACCMFCFSPVL